MIRESLVNDQRLAGGDVGCERHNVQNCQMCVSEQSAVQATLQAVALGHMNATAQAVLRQAVLEARVQLRAARARLLELERECQQFRDEALRYSHEIMDLQRVAGDPIEIDPTMGVIKVSDLLSGES